MQRTSWSRDAHSDWVPCFIYCSESFALRIFLVAIIWCRLNGFSWFEFNTLVLKKSENLQTVSKSSLGLQKTTSIETYLMDSFLHQLSITNVLNIPLFVVIILERIFEKITDALLMNFLKEEEEKTETRSKTLIFYDVLFLFCCSG